MICCFLGHSDASDQCKERLGKEIVKIYKSDCNSIFYVGTHGLFDQYVRETLRKLKKELPDLDYRTVLAYLPTKKDAEYTMERYENTVYPDTLENTPKKYAIIKRNEWMIAKSDVVICYKTNNATKTADFVNFAERKGKKIINLYLP